MIFSIKSISRMSMKTDLLASQFFLVFSFLSYALLPIIFELGFVQIIIVIVSLVFGYLLKLHSNKKIIAQRKLASASLLRLSLTAGLLCFSVVYFWLSDSAWLSGEAVVNFFSLFLALKWLESKGLKELYIVVYGALVMVVISSRYLSGASVLLFVLVGCLFFVCTLYGLESRKPVTIKSCLLVLKLFLFALPLVVMLFFTFPRIQGPLWDLGIVLGLPISLVVDQNQQENMIKGTLKAGQISRLKQDNTPVLVAEFENSTPFKSRLYWRGPVFNYYDGVEWHLDKDWDDRNSLLKTAYKGLDLLEHQLVTKSELVRYEARVSANNSRYLYALDLPAGRSTESFISDEFQLLGIRKLTSEFNYEQAAWLDYSGGRVQNNFQRNKYLQLPQHSNPRLLAWGNALADKHLNADDRIQALRVHLAQGDYTLTEKPTIEASSNSLDTFFFDDKDGGVEHLASSTAIVLRAAGIPTRLVTGYRGGSIIALTNFIIVRHANAHVWVEAWRDDIGWSRVEAKDFVIPPPKEKKSYKAKATKKLVTAAKKSQTVVHSNKKNAGIKDKASQVNTKNNQNTKQQKNSSEFQWLNTIGAGIETWIFNYNPERQIALIKKVGISDVDWKGLLSVAGFGVIILFTLFGLFLNIRRVEQDPIAASFQRLNRHLAKHNLQCLPQECPTQWLLRMKVLAPEMYPILEVVVKQYINLRYRMNTKGSKKGTVQLKEFKRDIKRLSAML